VIFTHIGIRVGGDVGLFVVGLFDGTPVGNGVVGSPVGCGDAHEIASRRMG
jgi:hypothetical protein